MIDPKSFIEFFEKEYGVKFVDAKTGKSALEIINQKKTCGTCKHVAKGASKILHADDMVCANPDSVHASDFMTDDDCCEFWKSEKKDG